MLKCLAYESQMSSILNLIVGISVGCQLTRTLFPYLKVLGCPLICPLYPFMEVVGSLICIAKFPWAANSAVHFFIQSSGLPTELLTTRGIWKVMHIHPYNFTQ